MSKGEGNPSESTPTPAKEVRSILKVAVLSEPYFPKQKLSVKFNSVVLQHMELEDVGDSKSSYNGQDVPY